MQKWRQVKRSILNIKHKTECHKSMDTDNSKKIECLNPIFSFHKSVPGNLHILKNRPCEDYSISFSEENGKYHIAIVADGHGSAECFRSDFGSKTAVEVALDTFKKFAADILEDPDLEKQFYDKLFSDPRYKKTIIRQQTDAIIREWKRRVEEHYVNNPPTKEELQKAEIAENANLNIPHIYGTTLIAVLWLPECVIVVHQGDGRCVVFYDDGTVDQPVPWDDRCIGTAVTSMCDADAESHIRSKVLNLNDEKKAIACYLGSDGVEDAYRDTYDEKGLYCMGDMGGVYAFYKNLTCEIIEQGQHQIEPFLEQMLKVFSAEGLFSRTGSGDDVSVAGIVNVEAIQKYCKQFKQDIQVYDLKEKLFWKEDELRGKTRKHGILLKRMNDAEAEIPKVQTEIVKLEKEIALWVEKQSDTERKIQELKDEIQERCSFKREDENNDIQNSKLILQEMERAYKESEEKGESGLKAKIEEGWVKFKEIVSKKDERKQLQNTLKLRYDKKIINQKECIEKIEKLKQEKETATDSLQQSKEKFAEAEKKFKEFDENYRRIENECKQIQNEIDNILNQ